MSGVLVVILSFIWFLFFQIWICSWIWGSFNCIVGYTIRCQCKWLDRLIFGWWVHVLFAQNSAVQNRVRTEKTVSFQWRIQDFSQEGAPTPKVGVLTYFFGWKLHENERIWTPGGGASLAPPLDPPLHSKSVLTRKINLCSRVRNECSGTVYPTIIMVMSLAMSQNDYNPHCCPA